LPECLDDWVDEGNSIRAVDVFVDALELRDLGRMFLLERGPAPHQPNLGKPSFLRSGTTFQSRRPTKRTASQLSARLGSLLNDLIELSPGLMIGRKWRPNLTGVIANSC